jgi:hypothetical protein
MATSRRNKSVSAARDQTRNSIIDRAAQRAQQLSSSAARPAAPDLLEPNSVSLDDRFNHHPETQVDIELDVLDAMFLQDISRFNDVEFLQHAARFLHAIRAVDTLLSTCHTCHTQTVRIANMMHQYNLRLDYVKRRLNYISLNFPKQ